mmetsp:Transcript_4284/g.4712  ORF Transcript_4284/g.4712 Transcript_4284/m.4712 type:complete len:293 (-) Transcript_4284:199-1077(-)
MPFRTRTLIYLFTGLIFQLANKNVCLAFYQIGNVNGSLDTKYPYSKISHYTTNGVFNLYGRPRPLQLRDSPYVNGGITALSLLPLSQLIIDSDPYHVSSILISQVETFDGSSIVSPVVVSTIYWTNVKSKLFLLLLGQFVAGFALAVATPTILPKLADMMGVTIGDNVSEMNTKSSRGNINRDEMISKLFSTSSSPDVQKLFQCLLIDFVGSASELVPFTGELSDLIWAPIASLWLRTLFYGSNTVFLLELTEEILPFTDIIPLATCCWVVETYYAKGDVAKVLGIGDFKKQ